MRTHRSRRSNSIRPTWRGAAAAGLAAPEFQIVGETAVVKRGEGEKQKEARVGDCREAMAWLIAAFSILFGIALILLALKAKNWVIDARQKVEAFRQAQ